MPNTDTTAQTVTFTAAEVIYAVTRATGASIRRAAIVARDAGLDVPMVSSKPVTSPDTGEVTVPVVHYFHADGLPATINRCGAAMTEPTSRHGRDVTCEACKALHAAEVQASTDEPADSGDGSEPDSTDAELESLASALEA